MKKCTKQVKVGERLIPYEYPRYESLGEVLDEMTTSQVLEIVNKAIELEAKTTTYARNYRLP